MSTISSVPIELNRQIVPAALGLASTALAIV